ncbi:hypothetical protein DYU11_01655 [Fibrisoma montanum]|uniref:Uncharacterized protein n=1 Tax=Fibrisoma montanum TaxID=2305895 RepID=A0A418MHZ4_9BACT|nr:CFI-box-CTERM domain-containing protein [Fibrisoma montanum]RIV27049.1 hypothetical protein DYU11_01655 [Fibrisoma montanum]
MAYRRYKKRRYRGWSGRSASIPKYNRLIKIFGDVIPRIKQSFFELERDALDELFDDYGTIYGEAAEEYARKTFPKWKNYTTNLSGQTMERLVELVPPYLSSQQRYSLLQIVLEKYKRAKHHQSVRINSKDPIRQFSELEDKIKAMDYNESLAYLPDALLSAAKWLYDDDITAARAMLAEAEKRENDIIRANAIRDLELLKSAVLSGQVNTASYSVEMPRGVLHVTVYEQSKCFVATVCFGSESREVEMLRYWRDTALLHSSLGRKFIVWYYTNGQTFASIINKLPLFTSGLRFILHVFIFFLHLKKKQL